MSIALALLGAIWSFFTDPAAFLSSAAHWTAGYTMPPQLQTWFLGTLGAPTQSWDGSVIYQDVYRVVQGPALLIAGVAGAGRVLRGALDHRLAGGNVALDTLPRLLLALVLIGVPGTHVSVGYVVIAFAVDASMAFAHELFSLLMQASKLQGAVASQNWLDLLISMILGNSGGSVLVAAALIPLVILVLYALVLMVLRTVMLGFCIATAPLCLATMAFDANNRFFRWWLDLFIGVLTAPSVLGVAVALSLTLAANLVTVQPPIGALLAVIVMCGGLWMAAKMVHALTWRHFGHGGAIAGFTAGVTTMLAPLHKLAEVGQLASTLGGRGGGGSAGATSSFAASGALAGAGGGVAPRVAAGVSSSVGATAGASSSDGPPNIAAALGASGRAAIAGAEAQFSQHAFNSFAGDRSGRIDALTRDIPAGSIGAGDRAMVAWNRTSSPEQHEFAEDHLALWLGSASRTAGDAGTGAFTTLAGMPA